jgi:EmrB/QacA subfamily drug resistance transporter
MTGMFLISLDSTVVATAMPTVVAQLGDLSLFSWVFSVYMLTAVASEPIFGRLCDIYGRKPLLAIGMALFLLGVALCGQARSMGQLIAFRAVQGLGVGALKPLIVIITGDAFPLERRAKVQGLFSGAWGVGSIVGPLLGGFVVDHLNWRWAFYLDIPFGLLTLLFTYLGLKEDVKSGGDHTADLKGIVLFGLAIVTFLLALLEARSIHSWNSLRIGSLLLSAVVFTALFLHVETRAVDPLLPLELLRQPILATANLTGFLTSMAIFSAISFLPLFVQGVIGTGATHAGASLSPLYLGWVICSTVGAHLILRTSYRATAGLALGLMSLGMFLLSRAGVQTTYLALIPNTVLMGVGGMALTACLILVQNAVGKSQRGIVTSAQGFFRSVGSAIGVTVMGIVLNSRVESQVDRILEAVTWGEAPQALAEKLMDPRALLDASLRAQLPQPVARALRMALADSLHQVFLLCFGITVLALVASFFLPGGRAGDYVAEKESPIATGRK